MELQVGLEIKNYRLLKKLGDGASGEVWHARDLNTPRDVAIKLMHLHLAASPKNIHRDRFVREANAVSLLGKHPNIPTFYDQDLEFVRPYFVMEYIRGDGVDNMIYDRSIMQIPHNKRIDIICQIGDALGYAHREGFVHRDIKPSNVKIIGDDTAYLLDFSVAFEADDTSRTQLGIGTPLYMPPEIFPSKLGDIFSLALVSFEIMYAEHPIFMDTDVITTGADAKLIMDERLQQESWKRPSQLDLLEGLNVDYKKLDAVFAKSFAHNPTLRYDSANKFCDDLQNAVGISHTVEIGSEVAPRGISTVEITGVMPIDQIEALAAAAKSSPLATLNVGEPSLATNIVPPPRKLNPWLIGIPVILVLAALGIGFLLLGGDDRNNGEVTDVPTSTPTETATATATLTETATATETSTDTPSPTPTETATESPTPTNTPTPSDTPTPTLTFTPSNTPTETHTPTPTSTATPSHTPEPQPSEDLGENLLLLYELASDVDEYPCPFFNQTYEYIQEQQQVAGTDHAEYGEQLTDNDSAMSRIYTRFCRGNTAYDQPLPGELEEYNDEFLQQLQTIVRQLTSE